MDGAGKLTDQRSTSGTPHWAKLAIFPSTTAAELARQQLEGADIPVAVINDQTGIFGPGFSGASILGVTVLVPAELLDEAKELLADFLTAFGGELANDD